MSAFTPQVGDVIDVRSVRGWHNSVPEGEVVVAVTSSHVHTAYVTDSYEPVDCYTDDDGLDNGPIDDFIVTDYYRRLDGYVFSIHEETT